MRPILRYVKGKSEEITTTIERFAACESPSDSPRDVNRFGELLVESARDIADAKLIRSKHGAHHVLLEMKVPATRKGGKRILALGHSDTVWPLGTLETMPVRRAKGRLWGPGVLDMKAGLAFFLYAVRALRDLDIPIARKAALLVVSDEETGSHYSRELTEREAVRSECVLVLEPGTGLAGKLKTARKGIAAYRLKVTGRAAHSGVDFSAGASAIVELAKQIERIAGLTDLARGTTVNPGLIRGGTRTNVVAAEAETEIDARVTTLRDAASLDRKIRAFRPVDKRCLLDVEGGLNRPPMERTKAIAALFATARDIAAEWGGELEESSTGGGSDGNFTAALGIPTLDGLGAVGEGAHALNESILLNRIPDRVALLAGLLTRL